MPIKAVLFDIDGTLVDSNEQHVLAWQQAFADFGHAFDPQTIHDQIGKGSDMLVPTLLPKESEARRTAMGEAHGTIFKARFLPAIRPFPQAHALLAAVHASGRQVVLASSASKDELDHYLDLLDARHLVSASTTADDVDRTKPAPDIFAQALQRIAPITADEAIVLGDTPYDVQAAAKCGMVAIGLRSGGFTDAALRGAGAVTLYDDAADLLARMGSSPLAA